MTNEDSMLQRGRSSMTKKKYYELRDSLLEDFDEAQVDDVILRKIKLVLNFDPSVSTYTKEMGQKVIEWRKEKSRVTGVPCNVISGAKACYERKKALRNQSV